MSEINFLRQHYQEWEWDLAENILDGTSKYFTLDGNKKDQNHCDVTFIWGEITLMSGQTLMKRTKYIFLFFFFCCIRQTFYGTEDGAFVKVFSQKHIKDLYLSSLLTQKRNFSSLPLIPITYTSSSSCSELLLIVTEGQSWFGKWLELPWYWCVRVELSLQRWEEQECTMAMFSKHSRY